MRNQHFHTTTRLAAYATLIGSLAMITGAALWAASGADIDRALDNGELAEYLLQATASSGLLIANLSIWIIGVFLLGIGGTLMSRLCVQRKAVAITAAYCFRTAVPIVIVAYVAWLAIVVRIAPSSSATAAEVAEVMGWFASRADWIATILILGIGPALIAIAGRPNWVPRWLAIWSCLALFAGLLNAIAMYSGGLTSYGFLIIPVGMSWMIATSVVLFKRAQKGVKDELAAT